MMRARNFARPLCLTLAFVLSHPAAALTADLSCNGLLETGQTMSCTGSEPNWGLEISCDGGMSSVFLDAFSGDGIQRTPGSISFATQDPWQLETSHPVSGTIAHTPAGCTDESDAVYDFTLTPIGAPGLEDRQLYPLCCRIK